MVNDFELAGFEPAGFAFVELGARQIVVTIFLHVRQPRLQCHCCRAIAGEKAAVTQCFVLHFFEANINARQLNQLIAIINVLNKQMLNITAFARKIFFRTRRLHARDNAFM